MGDEKAPELVAPKEKEKERESKPTLVDQAKEKFEEVQHTLDERVKAIMATFRPLQQLQQEVRRLNERIEELERKSKKGPPED